MNTNTLSGEGILNKKLGQENEKERKEKGQTVIINPRANIEDKAQK
jgi:hypothetical protein